MNNLDYLLFLYVAAAAAPNEQWQDRRDIWNKILWKFSIIYENGILSVYVFQLLRDNGHWSQKYYNKYVQKTKEQCKRQKMGPKKRHHPKKGKFTIWKVKGFFFVVKAHNAFLE